MGKSKMPAGTYHVLPVGSWVAVTAKGEATLIQDFQISAGEHVGKEIRVETPITGVTGTVEFK